MMMLMMRVSCAFHFREHSVKHTANLIILFSINILLLFVALLSNFKFEGSATYSLVICLTQICFHVHARSFSSFSRCTSIIFFNFLHRQLHNKVFMLISLIRFPVDANFKDYLLTLD